MHYVLGLLRNIRDTRVRCASWVYAKRFYIVQLNCFWRSFFYFLRLLGGCYMYLKHRLWVHLCPFYYLGWGSTLLYQRISISCIWTAPTAARTRQWSSSIASLLVDSTRLFSSLFFIWIIWLYFSISYSVQLNTYTLARLWIQCLKTSCTWWSSSILIIRTYAVRTHTHTHSHRYSHTYRLALTRDKR